MPQDKVGSYWTDMRMHTDTHPATQDIVGNTLGTQIKNSWDILGWGEDRAMLWVQGVMSLPRIAIAAIQPLGAAGTRRPRNQMVRGVGGEQSNRRPQPSHPTHTPIHH